MSRWGSGDGPGASVPWVHLVNAVLLVGLWAWSWAVFPAPPAHLPEPIGPRGPPGGAPRPGEGLALPLTSAALRLGSYWLGPPIRRARPLNLSTAPPITHFRPEDQARIRHLTARYLLWMNAILIGGLWLLQIHQRAAVLAPSPGPARVPALAILSLVVAPAIASLFFLSTITHLAREAEPRARRP